MWQNRFQALSSDKATTTSSLPSASSNNLLSLLASSMSNESNLSGRRRHEINTNVFVAGLPFDISLDELKERLTAVIGEIINPLSVKIIDDLRGQKAAFVQARSNEDALLLLSSYMILDGKPLRTEMARAHRALLVSLPGNGSAKLRVVRNEDGVLKMFINEPSTANLESWTPARPEDPFSGFGYTIPRFTYTESSLRKICELVGPLETFRRLSDAEAEALQHIHPSRNNKIEGNNEDEKSGLWEIKWGCREDAMDAKNILSGMTGVRWSWAHLAPQRTGFTDPIKGRFRPQHSYEQQQRPSALDARTPGPPSLGSDDFPPLSATFKPTQLGTRQVKGFNAHRRTVSDDSNAPATPISFAETSLGRDASLEIVDRQDDLINAMNGIPSISSIDFVSQMEYITGKEELKGTPVPPTVRPTPTSTAKPTPVSSNIMPVEDLQQNSTQPESTRLPDGLGMGASVGQANTREARLPQFDMTTLYVTGIPKNSTDEELMDVFKRFGKVLRVPRIISKANAAHETVASFVVFGSVAEAAGVIREVNDNIAFELKGHRLRIRYRRNSAGYSVRGRGRFTRGRGGYTTSGQVQNVSTVQTEDTENEDTSTSMDDNSGSTSFTNLEAQISFTTTEGDKSTLSEMKSQMSPPSTMDVGTPLVDVDTQAVARSPKDVVPVIPSPSQHSMTNGPDNGNAITPTSTSGVTAPPPYEMQHHQQTKNPYSLQGFYPSPWPGYVQGQTGPQMSTHPSSWVYPVYPPPVYGVQYWYPPSAMPFPPLAYPEQARPPLRVDTAAHARAHPSQPHMAAAYEPTSPHPVAPTGYYRNLDGGISYIYPPEVLERYKAGQATQEGGTEQSHPAPGVQMYHANHPPAVMNMPSPPPTSPYGSHPAVYFNYTPVPPPMNRMPQAPYVYSPQGVVQHVEPSSYAAGPAAAVVANYPPPPTPNVYGEVQDNFASMPTPSRFIPPPIPPPFAYPQVPYGMPYSPTIAEGGEQHVNGPLAGRGGGYRRRGSRSSYGISGQGRAGSFSKVQAST